MAGATNPYRMFAIAMIGHALDDISPRTGPKSRLDPRTAELAEMDARDALMWVEGAPSAFPAYLACEIAEITVDLLRHGAETRATLRWPALEGTVAA